MNKLSEYQNNVLASLEQDGLISASDVADIVAANALGSSVENRMLWETISEMFSHQARIDLLNSKIAENKRKLAVISQGVISNYCKKAVE